MKQIQRPCINCRQLTTNTTRCNVCQTIYNKKHPKPKREHYAGNYKKRAKQVRDNATHCWLCGDTARTNDPWTADHVIAGDKHSPLLPAHRSCNSRRGNKPPTTHA
jgi:rubredoxin